jgi:hypothetical protein
VPVPIGSINKYLPCTNASIGSQCPDPDSVPVPTYPVQMPVLVSNVQTLTLCQCLLTLYKCQYWFPMSRPWLCASAHLPCTNASIGFQCPDPDSVPVPTYPVQMPVLVPNVQTLTLCQCLLTLYKCQYWFPMSRPWLCASAQAAARLANLVTANLKRSKKSKTKTKKDRFRYKLYGFL